MVMQQQQSSNTQHMTPVRNSSDNSNGDSDFYLPDCNQSPLEESNITTEETAANTSDDWLMSIPKQLGKSVLSLDQIKEGGSFHASSRAPEFYYFESQHPGQGAKYLTAMPFSVEPCLVADEEAEFHLRMTKFLTRLT